MQSPSNLLNDFSPLIADFLSFNPREEEQRATQLSTTQMVGLAKQGAFETFKMAAQSVPAYKDFLDKNNFRPEEVSSPEDFQKIPITSKENYLLKYPIQDLLVNGDFKGKWAVTLSSGSSGKPFYWPRFIQQDIGASRFFDSLLVNLFDIDRKKSLLLTCAGMGVWTAGDMNSIAAKLLSLKYPGNTSMSPGIDLDNTFRVLNDLGRNFEQTIIFGYPPFLKDIVDNASQEILDLKLKFIAYGEPFAEGWRNVITRKVLPDGYPHKAVGSLLGSSEAGMVGSEYANAITLRQLVYGSKELTTALFGESRVPSVVQYIPKSMFIEEMNSNLVLTNKGALPLIRYDTKDYGGVTTAEEIEKIFQQFGRSFEQELNRREINNIKLPYAYLFGRGNTSSIYGVLIFPEMIKECLTAEEISNYVSGKFIMKTDFDQEDNQYLGLTCELKNGCKMVENLEKFISFSIAKSLSKLSSEYGKLFSTLGQKVAPRITLKGFGDQEHFSSSNKQKYTE